MDTKIKMSPKDFFLYVGAMVTLYVSVVSLLMLWFQYINILFPDRLEYYYDPFSAAIRFAMASLIIIFPLYIFLTRLINQDIRRYPQKRDLWIRRWLIYITLFIAGITIVIDLVVLLNTFLGGELTTRFVLKVCAVLVVVGGGFGYYFNDLKGRWEKDASLSKTIGWITSAVVVVSIIGGFFIVGTPLQQRLLRFDQQKVNDLQNIQWQVVNYWQQKEVLPESLDALEDSISGFIAPKDSQTDEAYGYNVMGNLEFELCAVFNNKTQEYSIGKPRPFPVVKSIGIENVNWEHGVGETCFERTIDPDLYPPRIDR